MTLDVKQMLEQQPDFIAIKRYQNSLAMLLQRYPDGVPSHIGALALDLTEQQVEERYQAIISCLRKEFGLE